MPITIRTIITAAVPTLAALFGIFWFRRKKKPPAIEDKPQAGAVFTGAGEEVIQVKSEDVANASPALFVTQPSQPTPEAQSFDISEALAKAVAEGVSEVTVHFSPVLQNSSSKCEYHCATSFQTRPS